MLFRNVFAEKLSNDTVVQNTVEQSKSYPLIRELAFSFGWRVGEVVTHSSSIEAGRQAFVMYDKNRLPIAQVFVRGVIDTFNFDKQEYEETQYVVWSPRLIHKRGRSDVERHSYISNKVPYIARNLKNLAKTTNFDDMMLSAAFTPALEFLDRRIRSEVGSTSVNLFSMDLSAEDIYELLDSKFNGTILTDESKYKKALDLFNKSKDNRSQIRERLEEVFGGDMVIVHATTQSGLYVTKVRVPRQEGKEVFDCNLFEVIESPRYVESFTDLENEYPMLTLAKAGHEELNIGEGRFSGIPYGAHMLEGLDIATDYNHIGSIVVGAMVMPCPKD